MSTIRDALRQRQSVIWLMIFAVAVLAAPLANESHASAGAGEVAGGCVFAPGPDTFSSVHIVPPPIPDDHPNGLEDCIAIDDPRTINDLRVALDISHTWVGDLVVTLTHEDTGTSVTLIDRPGVEEPGALGCAGDDVDVTLDDSAVDPVDDQCGVVPTIDGTFSPSEPLSAFDDESIAGTWTLTVSDHLDDELGALNAWSLIPDLKPVEACHDAVQNGHIFTSPLEEPLPIPDDDPNGVGDCIIIHDPRMIDGLTVALDISHPWVGDLVVTLTHKDTGTSVTLLDRPGVPAIEFDGCSGFDVDVTLDDNAALPAEDQCEDATPTIDGTFSPNEPLSAFDGESVAGLWTLTTSDHFAAQIGTLASWSLILEPEVVEACHDAVQNGHIFASPLEDPLPIPDDDNNGVEDCIMIEDNRTINSISVALEINHTRVQDLVVILTHKDTEEDVQLLFHPTTESGDLCPGDDIDIVVGNPGRIDVDTGCGPGTPTLTGLFKPSGSIGHFDGESMAGTWTLRVSDETAGELGALVSWSIIGGLEGPPPVCPPAQGSGNAFSDELPGPLPIPRNDPAGVIDCMIIEDDVPILDLDVALEIDHTFVSHLVVRLTHDDTGTTAVLIDCPSIPQFLGGCGFDNIRVVLNDEAPSSVEDQCQEPELAIGGEFSPNEALSAFDGESMAGTWTLHIVDEQDGDRGDLIKWTLIVGPEDPSPTATVTATVTPEPTETPLPPGEFLGDVNCDSTVNAIDAALILQFGAGLVNALACQQDADVNGDGRINAVDAALILQFTAGLIATLPP